MKPGSILTALALGAIVLLGVFLAPSTELLELKGDETVILAVSNMLLVYFILALLIERACEVVMDLLTAFGAVVPKDPTSDAAEHSARRLISMMICLVFAVVITLAGLRLVEAVLGLTTDGDVTYPAYFAYVDAILTCLILTGGSDGLHQIIRSILGAKTPGEADA